MSQTKSTFCDSEPIHLINELQDFGLLIIISPEHKKIIAVGENCPSYLGLSPEDVLGQQIDDFFPELNIHLFELDDKLTKVKNNVLSIAFSKLKTIYFINIRKIDEFIILEIEVEEEGHAMHSALEFNTQMASILSTKNIGQICDFSVKTIQKLGDFDRVVLYKFKEDFSGEVIAETKKESIDSLFGFHFPASDIPLPARKMFENNPIRVVIRKSNRVLRMIRTKEYSKYNFNLGGAGLRAPHSQHIEYLTNMGIDTSLSISLVCEERLWGLIICHNLQTRVPSPSIKNYMTVYANLVSIQLDLMIRNEISSSSLEIETRLLRLIERINQSQLVDIAEFFKLESVFFLRILEADGFLIQWNGVIHVFGENPSLSSLSVIFEFLESNHSQKVFFTDQLGSFDGFESADFESFPGIFSLPISFHKGDRLVWFKKEMPRTILWGGNPESTIIRSSQSISPRKSFEKFIENVKGKSAPWPKSKIIAMESFLALRDIIERKIIISDLEQSLLKVKNSEADLRNLNLTKDRFFSIISHNLRSPFSALIGYSDILLEALSDISKIDLTDVKEYAKNISVSAFKAFKLLNNLFEWGRLQTGKIVVERREFELSTLADELKYTFIPSFKEKDIVLKISCAENLKILSDYDGLLSIITQVFNNAKKFSKRFTEVYCQIYQTNELSVFEVIDQGIGISLEDLDKLFKIDSKFLNPGTEGETGTGLGLIIAKDYLTLLNGEISISSTLGQGTAIKISIANS